MTTTEWDEFENMRQDNYTKHWKCYPIKMLPSYMPSNADNSECSVLQRLCLLAWKLKNNRKRVEERSIFPSFNKVLIVIIKWDELKYYSMYTILKISINIAVWKILNAEQGNY